MSVHTDLYASLPVYAFDIFFFERYFHGASNVLDVGCSIGHQMRVHPEVKHGLDFEKASVAEASKQGLRVKLCDVGREYFPHPRGMFCGVECRHLLEHLTHPQRLHCLAEIRRVLRVGGTAVLDIPNIENMKWKFWNHYQHEHPLTLHAFKSLVRDSGFEILWSGNVHPGFGGANLVPVKLGLLIQDFLYFIGIRSRQVLRVVAKKVSDK